MISRLPTSNASVQGAQATSNRYERGNSLPQDGTTSPQTIKDDSRKGSVADKELAAAVSNVNDFVQQIRRELQFSIDKESGRTVVKVINAETDEVVRQIPPEEVLSLARHLAQGGNDGLLLRSKA